MMDAFARLLFPFLAVTLMLVTAVPCSLANRLEEEDPAASDDASEPVFGEQVVVTATGIETPAEEVGSTITVLTIEEMDRKDLMGHKNGDVTHLYCAPEIERLCAEVEKLVSVGVDPVLKVVGE